MENITIPEDMVLMTQEDFDNLIERAEYAERQTKLLYNLLIDNIENNIKGKFDSKFICDLLRLQNRLDKALKALNRNTIVTI